MTVAFCAWSTPARDSVGRRADRLPRGKHDLAQLQFLRCQFHARKCPGGVKDAVDCDSAEQRVDRVDELRNVDLNRIPQNAMVDQIVAVDEAVS